MKAEQTLRQTLGLKQQITVQMVQSLKVLQMSGQDLIAFVQETVLGNPLLEWDTSWKTRAQFEAVGTTPVNESITAQQEAGPRDVLPSITVDLHALDHLPGHSEADPFITEKIREAEQLLFHSGTKCHPDRGAAPRCDPAGGVSARVIRRTATLSAKRAGGRACPASFDNFPHGT